MKLYTVHLAEEEVKNLLMFLKTWEYIFTEIKNDGTMEHEEMEIVKPLEPWNKHFQEKFGNLLK